MSVKELKQFRIIPAYAGSTLGQYVVRAEPSDHPRIRGEHVRVGTPAGAGRGSSPHTRGAPIQITAVERTGGIIPAYAGSTFPFWAIFASIWDHPRIRGEHHIKASMFLVKAGSSPHTRGARLSAGACCRA